MAKVIATGEFVGVVQTSPGNMFFAHKDNPDVTYYIEELDFTIPQKPSAKAASAIKKAMRDDEKKRTYWRELRGNIALEILQQFDLSRDDLSGKWKFDTVNAIAEQADALVRKLFDDDKRMFETLIP